VGVNKLTVVDSCFSTTQRFDQSALKLRICVSNVEEHFLTKSKHTKIIIDLKLNGGSNLFSYFGGTDPRKKS
jgi:hypothetical protein